MAMKRMLSSARPIKPVPLTGLQRAFVAAGSAALAFADPRRGDLVAAFGDVTGGPPLARLRARMAETEEGRSVLLERPRVTSETLAEARRLAPGTLGRAYADFMDGHGYEPSGREPARFVDDEELAYVMTRYREVHDFWHVLTGLPTTVLGEVAQKYYEAAQTGLPVCVASALAGPARVGPSDAARLLTEFVPWALRCHQSSKFLMGVYVERRMSHGLGEVRAELGIVPAPPVQ